MEADATANVQLPVWLREPWNTARVWVNGFELSYLLWERVFSTVERRRLGKSPEEAYRDHRGNVGMWRRLYGVSVPRAVVEINRSLNLLDARTADSLLRALGEAPGTFSELRDWAIEQNGLVFIDTERAVYWKGREIETDWHKRGSGWNLFWMLGREAKRNQPIDRLAFGRKKPDYLKKAVSRFKLGAALPADLAKKIISAGRGTYRLSLRPTDIFLFEGNVDGSVRELKGSL